MSLSLTYPPEARRAINHLFLFIGAEPNTNWLKGSGISLDTKGFVLTGDDAGAGRHTLETTRRGVFAIGDVLGWRKTKSGTSPAVPAKSRSD